MAELAVTVAAEFADYYRKVGAEMHTWVDPLSQEEFWRKPYSYGNSVGHLVLHMTGNLSYYIGARVAETGYVRDREREFTEARKLDKGEVLEAFDRTIDMVVASVRAQAPGDWMAAYSGEREPEATNRLAIFLRCAAHAYHHLGQIIYLSRELARQAEQKAISA
ncbi:MAG TPA: DinB family protein [Candidatus Dormibacteraeota bacterium]|nr:DinB family protein [Candidatus Dormibacteraeota bacterium]